MRYALLFVLSTGCAASFSDVAATRFSSVYTCPTDRISSHERDDLHIYTNVSAAQALTVFPDGHPPPAPPVPDDIRRDPERLDLWFQQNAPHINPDEHVYTATGCGHEALYICDRDQTRHHTYTMCADAPSVPAPASAGSVNSSSK
ncbi:MAG TPA: hypothetical protein VGG74_18130 [Kofleriaceae bacterium]|jgi:hypothetical protein